MQAYFTLNNFCNQKCITCPTGSNCKDSNYIPFELLKERIVECKKKGMDSVVLSGGEPLAYPYILECISYLYKLKINITILTNGTMLNKEIIKKLVKFKEHIRVVVAIHSDIPSEHDFVTSTVGSFDILMSNIIMLDKLKFHVCFKIILNKISFLKLKEISCMLEYKLKNPFTINVCSMDMCNISEKNKNICLTGKEVQVVLNTFSKWYTFKKNKKYQLYISEFPICLMTKYSMPYLQTKKGKNNFAIIPRHSTNVVYNSKYDCFPCLEYCKVCMFESLCPGIWSSNVEYFKNDCRCFDIII